MAHIVIVTSDLAGRVHVSEALGRRLRAVGHRATVASPAGTGRERTRGPDLVRMAPMPQPAPAARFDQIRRVRRRRAAALRSMSPETWTRQLASLDPDLVLIDIELAELIVAAAPALRNVALWTSMMSVWKRPGLPPLHTGIVPGSGWRGSALGMESAWLEFRVGKWIGNLRRRFQRAGVDRISVLRALAAQTGFPFDDEARLYDWLVPCTFRTMPVLSFNALEMEFPHLPAPNCRYVGPLFDEGQRLPNAEAEASSRLADLATRRRRGESSALIYCSFGAWHKGDDVRFLRRVVSAVAPRSDWDLVVGLGDRLGTDALGPVPPNVHLFRWAPQLEVLRTADLAIHHAGIGTVNECVASGVPMVVYPFRFLDQHGNAARVAYHGLGEVGDRHSEASGAIRNRIQRVLTDPAIRARAANMAAVVAAYDRTNRSIVAVEELL